MNYYRIAGDMSHLLAIIILLVKIATTKSSAGISGKSQILFSLVYITRYLDMFVSFFSWYNRVFKIVFISASLTTVFLTFVILRQTYEREHDTFYIEFLLIPTAVLAFYINHATEVLEVLWTFSIYLEAVAILPQFFFITKTGATDWFMKCYLFALGSYRGLYLLNWYYRYNVEGHYDLIAIYAGAVQTMLFVAFFCWYILKTLSEKAVFDYAQDKLSSERFLIQHILVNDQKTTHDFSPNYLMVRELADVFVKREAANAQQKINGPDGKEQRTPAK